MKNFGVFFGVVTVLIALVGVLSANDSGLTAGQNDMNRGSYYVNGEIHVGTYGQPEGKPLTTGHNDFKPSWSKTGDMLVFFRRVKNDPDVSKWKTAIHIINADGTGLHQLTDGTHTDFNQTWTRDGSNTPIWNRRNPKSSGYVVMASRVGAKLGEEFPLTDKGYSAWAFTCLTDGRILVRSNPPKQSMGYYLMTPGENVNPTFERIECELAKKGVLARVSLSPSETRVCFEFNGGSNDEFLDARFTSRISMLRAARSPMQSRSRTRTENRFGLRTLVGRKTNLRSFITLAVNSIFTNLKTARRIRSRLMTKQTIGIPILKTHQSDCKLSK